MTSRHHRLSWGSTWFSVNSSLPSTEQQVAEHHARWMSSAVKLKCGRVPDAPTLHLMFTAPLPCLSAEARLPPVLTSLLGVCDLPSLGDLDRRRSGDSQSAWVPRSSELQRDTSGERRCFRSFDRPRSLPPERWVSDLWPARDDKSNWWHLSPYRPLGRTRSLRGAGSVELPLLQARGRAGGEEGRRGRPGDSPPLTR